MCFDLGLWHLFTCLHLVLTVFLLFLCLHHPQSKRLLQRCFFNFQHLGCLIPLFFFFGRNQSNEEKNPQDRFTSYKNHFLLSKTDSFSNPCLPSDNFFSSDEQLLGWIRGSQLLKCNSFSPISSDSYGQPTIYLKSRIFCFNLTLHVVLLLVISSLVNSLKGLTV